MEKLKKFGFISKKNLKFRTSILCLGAAYFFYEGSSIINDFVDKYYLVGCSDFVNPFLFLKNI